MTPASSAEDAWSQDLSQALRAIRRARQLSVADVARRMGLARRSYASFEAGEGRMNFEKIMAFAHATSSDPYAIVASVMIGAPALAVRTADNKLLTAFIILLREFHAEIGQDIARLETQAVISAFSEAFKTLSATASVHRDSAAQSWLREGAAKLPKPPRRRRRTRNEPP